jgi:hypothetical protein
LDPQHVADLLDAAIQSRTILGPPTLLGTVPRLAGTSGGWSFALHVDYRGERSIGSRSTWAVRCTGRVGAANDGSEISATFTNPLAGTLRAFFIGAGVFIVLFLIAAAVLWAAGAESRGMPGFAFVVVPLGLLVGLLMLDRWGARRIEWETRMLSATLARIAEGDRGRTESTPSA